MPAAAFVSFDAISYFAGLTPIKFWPFFIATGVGQLPATIIYSYVGGMLTGGVKYFVTALLCIFSLGILVMIVRRIYMERQEKKKRPWKPPSRKPMNKSGNLGMGLGIRPYPSAGP